VTRYYSVAIDQTVGSTCQAANEREIDNE
jgi:hypothetical protein